MKKAFHEVAPDTFVLWRGETLIDGVMYAPSVLTKRSEQELAALRLYFPEQAADPPAGQRFVSGSRPTVARVNGVVRYVYPLEAAPLADKKVDRLAELAARRWEIETGGITVGELTVPSDRETQDRIDQIVKAYADGDIAGSVMFKLGPGQHIEVDETMLRAVKAAGALHIQQCFSREAELAAVIVAAADLPALEAIDVQGFWA